MNIPEVETKPHIRTTNLILAFIVVVMLLVGLLI